MNVPRGGRGAFFANVAAYGYGTALSMVAVPAVDYWVLGHRRQVEHVQTKAEDACSLLEQECFLDVSGSRLYSSKFRPSVCPSVLLAAAAGNAMGYLAS